MEYQTNSRKAAPKGNYAAGFEREYIMKYLQDTAFAMKYAEENGIDKKYAQKLVFMTYAAGIAGMAQNQPQMKEVYQSALEKLSSVYRQIDHAGEEEQEIPFTTADIGTTVSGRENYRAARNTGASSIEQRLG